MNENRQDIIIYNTADGKASVSLYAKDGRVWMSQNQLAKLFDTSKQNIGQHIANILKEKELDENSVVKNFFTTAADGKDYQVTFYSLEMVLAIGFRVRIFSLRIFMDGSCKKFFSGPGISGDKNGAITPGRMGGEIEALFQLGTASDDAFPVKKDPLVFIPLFLPVLERAKQR